MKNLLALFIISSQGLYAGGVGGSAGGTGPQMSIEKLLTRQNQNYSIKLNQELIRQIDNIELNSEIRYPNTLLEKVRILNDQEIKSFQLKSGEIYMKIDKKENGPDGCEGTPFGEKN